MPGLKSDMHHSDSDMRIREEGSDQSILSVMNRFVTAVNVMDETVMIPMRLKDIPLTQPPPNKPQNKGGDDDPDMYGFYHMLKSIKSELVSGPRSRTESEREAEDVPNTSLITVPTKKYQQMRRSSMRKGSVSSMSDSALSSSDSEVNHTSSESEMESDQQQQQQEQLQEGQFKVTNDLKTTSEDGDGDVDESDCDEDDDENAKQTTVVFRHHLHGLFGVLKHLTNTAQVLTNTYQKDIGQMPSSSSSTLSNFSI